MVRSPNTSRSEIRAQTQEALQGLENSLKQSESWPQDQPTFLDFDRMSGIVLEEGGRVEVGLVPVRTEDPNFFLSSKLQEYSESGGEYVILGAIHINDSSVFEQLNEEGRFAVGWEHVDGTLENDRLVLRDEQWNEAYVGEFFDINGIKIDSENDPARQILQPFARVAEGSWWAWICGDSRCARFW
jgi:hypothetical protein